MEYKKVVALKAVITRNCRLTHGILGAFDEAARRVRKEYATILKGWTRKGEENVPVFNLVLEVEYPSK